MFRFLVFVAVLSAGFHQAHAKATQTILYKHNHWPLSIVEFRAEKDGPASGYAYRYSWPRQMSDAYALYDDDGDPIAEAAFTGEGLLASTFGGAQMTVTGPEGKLLGHIKGSWATLHRAYFTFTDARDQPLAIAYIDYFGDDIFIVDAKTQHKMLAKMTYIEPLASMGVPYWTLTHSDAQALPAPMVYAFVSYMVDYQPWSTVYGWTNRVKLLLQTMLPPAGPPTP